MLKYLKIIVVISLLITNYLFYGMSNLSEFSPQIELLNAIKSQNNAVIAGIIKDHSIDVRDAKGNTLLISLAANAHLAEDDKARLTLMECLMGYGADINAQNNAGYTALMEAIGNSTTLVLELVDLGADPHKANNQGKTAYTIVQEYIHTDDIIPGSQLFGLERVNAAFKGHKKNKLL